MTPSIILLINVHEFYIFQFVSISHRDSACVKTGSRFGYWHSLQKVPHDAKGYISLTVNNIILGYSDGSWITHSDGS